MKNGGAGARALGLKSGFKFPSRAINGLRNFSVTAFFGSLCEVNFCYYRQRTYNPKILFFVKKVIRSSVATVYKRKRDKKFEIIDLESTFILKTRTFSLNTYREVFGVYNNLW